MAWPIDTTALLMVACIFICREIEVAGALEFEFCVHEDGILAVSGCLQQSARNKEGQRSQRHHKVSRVLM